MVQASYVKYGLISGFMLFCTVLLTATEVLAQITPAPANNDQSPSSTSSSPDTVKSPITPSPNPSTVPDGQDTTSSEEQVDGGTTTTENTEPDPTEILVEAITNQVNEALSDAGIGLGS
jgi:cytoskeletal protein RodZ